MTFSQGKSSCQRQCFRRRASWEILNTKLQRLAVSDIELVQPRKHFHFFGQSGFWIKCQQECFVNHPLLQILSFPLNPSCKIANKRFWRIAKTNIVMFELQLQFSPFPKKHEVGADIQSNYFSSESFCTSSVLRVEFFVQEIELDGR